MNVDYRTVWNHAIGAWVAVSGIGRGRGERACSGRAATGALAAAALVLGAGTALADTLVVDGTFVVDNDAVLGVGSVTVDNSLNRDATLQVNGGVNIGNEVILNHQGTLNNAGTISRTAAADVAVHSVQGGATVNNTATGRIQAEYIGVSLEEGGRVTNSGAASVISATGADSRGVFISGGAGTVSNGAGSITGGLNGVVIWGTGTVVNAGGIIRATTDNLGHGVEIVAGLGTVSNQSGGTITGKLFGVSLADGGTVTNTTAGTISADGTDPRAAGVIVGGGVGTVSNTGAGSIIRSPMAGVRLVEGGTVTNGVGATIQGATAIHVVAGSTLLSNAGTLVGDVLLDGTSVNQVRLFTGSRTTGQLQIGSQAASTLTLDGTGSQRYSEAVAGVTTFAGRLIKQGSGTWTLDRASEHAGGTSLKTGRLDLGHNLALGTGQLAMDDGTTLGFAVDGLRITNAIHMTGNNDPVIDTGAFSETLAGVISGGGSLTKQGSGTLRLAGANIHSGATNVAQGTLRANAANTFSASSAHSVAAGATLDTGGFNQTLSALTNAGTVNLRSAIGTVGGTLTVAGAYVGHNGVLQVATTLGDSASVSDRLLLNGANAIASGSTQVQVTNVAGLGALTTGDGIALVATANGGRVGANAFSLAGGHVDAGAFEYRMSSNEQGVYLRSTDTTPLYRAEVPLIAALPAQLREADLAMLANRHQRVGDSIDASAPADFRQAWGRILTVQRDIARGGAISPQSHGRLSGFQAGTDLFAGGSADAQWQAGLYVGQLDGDMSATGFARGIANLQAGRNTLNSQYLGAYGSFQSNTGLYVEAVLQAARHRYDVEAITRTSAEGKGSSLLASLEVGQSFLLAPGWRIEPQLQFVHRSLDLDDLDLGGLTTVGQHTQGGWILRAGIRVQGDMTTGIGTLKPYGRLNVYESPNGEDSASYRTPAALTVVATPTGGTGTEVAAGATLALNERTSVYGEIGQLRASGGSTRTGGGLNASVGMKVLW